MRKALLILCSLMAGVGLGRAQAPVDTVVHEDAGWKVHAGDDAAYAAPGFDDSSWQRIDFGNYLTGPVAEGRWRWFRKRVTLPAQAGAIDLMLVGTTGGFEVYVDGQRLDRRFNLRCAGASGITPRTVCAAMGMLPRVR